MKKSFWILACIASMGLGIQSCNKQLAPYQIVGFDAQANVVYMAIDSTIGEDVWLNTAYYVLDSINIVLNKENTNLRLKQLGLITYGWDEAASSTDSVEIGRYMYEFDTKHQDIRYKGKTIK